MNNIIEPEEKKEDKNSINSIKRAIKILNLYKGGSKYLGITEISKMMELPKSTIHRIVKTLQLEGWLIKDIYSEKYKLGFEILSIASMVRSQYDLKDVAIKEMKLLSKEVDETVILSVYTQYSGICIEKIESQNKIKLISEPGQIIPLHAGASGKILLAYAPEEDINNILSRKLEKYTENTITDKHELLKQLEDIRKAGYAYSKGESDLGSSAIGVPILDEDGTLLYGLSIAGPVDRMDKKGMEFLTVNIKQTARNITNSLKLLK